MNYDIILITSETCAPCKALKLRLTEVCDGLGLKYRLHTAEGGDALIAEHGIRAVPAVLILDEDGDEVDRFIGLKSVEFIKDFLEMNSCGRF